MPRLLTNPLFLGTAYVLAVIAIVFWHHRIKGGQR
jgi:hypothetical protein